MRVVKALVAFMGVLIVVGIGLVVYGLSLDKNNADTSVETSETTVTPSVPVAGTKLLSGKRRWMRSATSPLMWMRANDLSAIR